MLTCQKCGADNPLGRVFCTSCGGKLDLKDMSANQVVEIQQVSWLARHWGKLVAGVVVLAIIPVVLAFVPRTGYIGEKGTAALARSMEGYLRQIAAMPAGKSVGPYPFTEQSINAYFEFGKAKELKVDYVSVKVMDGYFMVRIVRTVGTVPLFKVNWTPQITYDLACLPAGTGVVVRKASMGRLPLVGPLKGLALGPVKKMLAGQKDWDALKKTNQVKAESGKISIWVKT